MNKQIKNIGSQGFSLIELMIAMTVTLTLLAATAGLFSTALATRARESRKTDALASARAALNIMSREISNSGYGLLNNGMVTADSAAKKIHFRANVVNACSSHGNSTEATDCPGEDVTYFYDLTSKSIVRYDPNDSPQTSVVINRISDINLKYFDYDPDTSVATERTVPTSATGRVTINVSVTLDAVKGQPNQTVQFTSDVTLRNSDYMLFQY